MIRDDLSSHGYNVEVTTDGEKAVRELEEKRFDLAICDWKMPGLSGPQLYDRITALSPETANRMIFMTGDVVSDSVQQFLRKHSKRCLSKPFSVDEFRQTIGEFITARN